jgi:hypothetical protein
MGFENESIMPDQGSSFSRRDLANVLKHYTEEDIYAVFDGSIGGQRDAHGRDGYEIVAHPRTLASHHKIDWQYLFTPNHVVHDTCGMHIHLSRSYFTRGHLLRLMQLVYQNEKFFNLVAEREPNEYTRSIPKEDVASEAAKWYNVKNNENRRVKVNLCNKHTVELRIFANVIDAYKLYKNLEFTHALYYYTKGDYVVTIGNFLAYIKRGGAMYKHIIKFLKENVKGVSLCV